MEGSIASLDDINLEQEWSTSFHGFVIHLPCIVIFTMPKIQVINFTG
jgi:hypothetical protein